MKMVNGQGTVLFEVDATGKIVKEAGSTVNVELTVRKGQANGYAGLDEDGLVPIAQLPGLPALVTIQDEGVLAGIAAILNFIGAGVSVVNNVGQARVDITIPGGAGDLALTKKAPSSSVTVTAGYSAYVSGDFELGDGLSCEIGALAVLEVG